MAINVTDAMQAAVLQSSARSAGFNKTGSFGSALMDAMYDITEKRLQAQPEMSAGADSAAYSIMSLMLGQGQSPATSMMLLSLYNALKGDSSANSVPGFYSGLYTGLYPGAYQGISAGSGKIPSQPGRPTKPAITSNVWNRSASLYTSVINQFSVETRERYQPDGGTYCNIFVWDVTTAMGAEIPHYFNAKTGKPMSYGDKGANQMNANAMYKWLHEHGDQYGWFEVTPGEAQELANQGHPVVTALYRSGQHGHVQVVCPSKDGVYDEKRGVTVAQAGRRLTSYRPIKQLYGKTSMSRVSYFAHM